MMVFDHVGDQEAMVYAQLGHQPLVRTTETSPEPRPGTLSCVSAQPPDLATATAAQPEVACVRPSIVPFLQRAPVFEARFGILDEFPILEVSPFPSASYHHYICPLVITPCIYIYMG